MITEVLSFARKNDREQFVKDIRTALASLDVEITIRSYLDKRDFTLTIKHQRLSASVAIWGTDKDRVPMICWFGASDRLQRVAGAWRSDNINPFHGCKASSFPMSMIEVIECLRIGFEAVHGGSAFHSEIEFKPVIEMHDGHEYRASYNEKGTIAVTGFGIKGAAEYTARTGDRSELSEAIDYTIRKIVRARIRVLAWQNSPCLIFGSVWSLRGLSGVDSASAYHNATASRFVAHGCLNGRYLVHNGKSLAGVVRRLENEIEKRRVELAISTELRFEGSPS